MAQFNNFRERWFKRYRLVLHEEQSYKERWQMTVNRWGLATASAAFMMALAGLTYFVIAWTPLREYIVPGYISEANRMRAINVELQADSALHALEEQQRFLNDLRTVLSGQVILDELGSAVLDSAAMADTEEGLNDWGLTDEDIALRERVEEEDRFALQRAKSNDRTSRSIPFAPLQGEISSEFDPAIGHFGVDFVAPLGSVIHAVDDGTVMLASYTSDGGYVVSIQHPGNRISVYKHNQSLLVEVGDRVQTGDPIAVLGGTGTHSTGPHSHFEWWVDGTALNPVQWLPEYASDQPR